MRLNLKRPLIVFDLEATGISTFADRIVQISCAKLLPDGTMDVRTRLIDPEMPIPPESTEIHGITDADVEGKPTFRQIARSLAEYLEGCDMGGFNIVYFDVPLLLNEFHRVDVPFSMAGRRILDAYQIYRKREPRTLEAALHYYCGESHDEAHDSEADVLATIKVMEGQFHKYEDLPRDVDQIDEIFNPMRRKYVDWEGKLRWEHGEIIIGFGKKIGTKLRVMVQTDRGFLEWILRSDFSAEVKQIVSNALDGIYPEPPPELAESAATTAPAPHGDEEDD